MGFLNNICMTLSTPNIFLINIIAIPATMIENLLILLLFTSILKIQSNWSKKLIYVLSLTVIGFFTLKFIPTPFNIFINYFMPIIIAFIIFREPLLKLTFSIILSLVIFNLLTILLLNPFITIFNINTESLSSIPIYRILYTSIIYTFTFGIIFILKSKNLKFPFSKDIDKKTRYIIYITLILGVVAIIIQSITLFYYVDTLPITITFLSFISLLLYFLISIYSLTRVFKLVLTTKKLEIAEEYNNTLHILHDNVRGFKHDFDNIVTTIGGYIKTNDMKGLKKYYIELEDDCERVNNLYILNPDIVNNDGIYNLLTKKYYEADSKDIKVNITFLLDLSTLNMKVYEFARILGIFLDNAIEASSECNDKIINLTFRNDCKNSRQLIIVENTYKNKDIDTEKIFEKGISGKENHTGLGLWEVRKIIKKTNNVNLYTTKDDKFFKQQLEIYY